MATFVHDADMLLVQAKIAREAANVLRKKQKEIHKKQQQTKSKNLQRRIEEYNSSLMDIREAVNRMEDVCLHLTLIISILILIYIYI